MWLGKSGARAGQERGKSGARAGQWAVEMDLIFRSHAGMLPLVPPVVEVGTHGTDHNDLLLAALEAIDTCHLHPVLHRRWCSLVLNASEAPGCRGDPSLTHMVPQHSHLRGVRSDHPYILRTKAAAASATAEQLRHDTGLGW